MARRLPQLIEELADRIGREKALNIARLLGGQKVFVPKVGGATWSAIAQLIGADAAAALIELRAGEYVIIPMAPCATRQVDIGTDPRKAREVARAFRCHIGHVYRCRAIYRRSRRGRSAASAAIGAPAAKALTELHGGEQTMIPACRDLASAERRKRIGTDSRPARVVAREFGCDVRTVFRLRAKYRRSRRERGSVPAEKGKAR